VYPFKHRYWGIFCPARHFVALYVAEMPDYPNPPKPPELDPNFDHIRYFCEKCDKEWPAFPTEIRAYDGPPPPEDFEPHRHLRRPQ